jgi:phosphoglycolate phosphatase-like HAD superfamily hydrolase
LNEKKIKIEDFRTCINKFDSKDEGAAGLGSNYRIVATDYLNNLISSLTLYNPNLVEADKNPYITFKNKGKMGFIYALAIRDEQVSGVYVTCKAVVVKYNEKLGIFFEPLEGQIIQFIESLPDEKAKMEKSTLSGEESNADWFMGEKDREAAEELLAGRKNGTFIVRTQNNNTSIVLSVVYKEKPTHHLIKKSNTADDTYIISKNQIYVKARTIRELIDKLSNEPLPEGWLVRLTNPPIDNTSPGRPSAPAPAPAPVTAPAPSLKPESALDPFNEDKLNYVPIDSTDASSILRGKPVGTYLLRYSTNKSNVYLNYTTYTGQIGNIEKDDFLSNGSTPSIPKFIKEFSRKELKRSEEDTGVKLRRKMVVWDFDQTFMKDHWWSKSENFRNRGSYEYIFEKTFDNIRNGRNIKIADCLSYPYMKVLLNLLYNNGYVLAIASFGSRELIIAVLKKLKFLRYFEKVNILSPSSLEKKDGTSLGNKNDMLADLMERNNIKDKNDVFFFDDDNDNIVQAKNTGYENAFNTPIPDGFNEGKASQLIHKLGFTPDFYSQATKRFTDLKKFKIKLNKKITEMITSEEEKLDEDLGKQLKKDLVFITPYKLKLKLPEKNHPKVFLTVFGKKYFVEYQESQKNQKNQEKIPFDKIKPLINFLYGLEALYNSDISNELQEKNNVY